MSPDLIRWVLAIVLIGHGIGHILFTPLAVTAWQVGSGESWILSGSLGSTPTAVIEWTLALASIALFVVGGAGVAMSAAWWRPVVVAGAVVSLALIGLFGTGLSIQAVWAAALDIVALGAILWLGWPSESIA
jgi:hypothetical protein